MERPSTAARTIALALVTIAGIALGGADPVLKCASFKIQASGKKASAKLTCHSKEIGRAHV